MKKLTIIAVVNFGTTQIDQEWNYYSGSSQPYLEVFQLQNGKGLMVKLEARFVKEIEEKRVYLGIVNASDGYLVPSN